MQGTSGCVLAPALTCEPGQPGNRNERVSKIHRRDNFYQEEKAIIDGLQLNEIDPDEDFCLHRYYPCQIEVNNDNRARINGTTCRRNAGEPPILRALNFKRGSIDLDQELQRQNVNYLTVLLRLSNVINGIVALNHTKRYHLDVKERNIVTHTHVFKLIDFGLSEFDPDLGAQIPRRPFRAVYRYWPIEAILLSRNSNVNTVTAHVQNYLDGNGQGHFDPLLFSFSTNILGVTQQNRAAKIKEWVAYIEALRATPDHKQRIFRQIDAWSINLILYRIWNDMPHQQHLRVNLQNFLKTLVHDGQRVGFKRSNAMNLKNRYDVFLNQIIPKEAPYVALKTQITNAYTAWVNRTNAANAAAAAAANAADLAAANAAALAAANAAALVAANAAAAAAALDAARCGNYFLNMNRRCIADNGRAAGRIIAAGGHLGAPCAMNFNGRRCVKSVAEKAAGRQTAKAAKEAQRVLCNNYFLDGQGRRCIADNGKPGRILRANNALGAPCAMVYHPATRRCRKA